MALEDRIRAFVDVALGSLGEETMGPEDLEALRGRASLKEDEVWLSPELADLQARVVRQHGRLGVASVRSERVKELLGDVGLPGGLAVYRIALQSSAPLEHVRAVWVSREGRCHAVALASLDALSGLLEERPSSSRLSKEELEAWMERVKSVIRGQALELAGDARRKLVTLQSRRAREVQSVYDVRMRELAVAGEGQDGVTVQELLQEQRRAQEHVSDHFDPDRLRVRMEPLFLLWLWPQPRARRGKVAP